MPEREINIGGSYDVCFSPDGRRLAASARYVHVWDVAAGRKCARAHPLSHPSHLAFSPAGDRLAVKNTSGRIVILDSESLAVVTDFANKEDGEGCALHFSPCGAYVVDGTWAGVLKVREAATGRCVFQTCSPGEMIHGIHPTSDGLTWLVEHSPVATSPTGPPPDNYFTLWRWPFGRAHPPAVVPTRCAFVRHCALSSDGQRLAVLHGAPVQKISVLELSDAKPCASLALDRGVFGSGLAWTRGGEVLAAVQGHQVVAYRAPEYTIAGAYSLEYASDVAFSPTGTHVALGSWKSGRLLRIGALVRTVE